MYQYLTLEQFHEKYFPNLNKTQMAHKIGITSCAYSKITSNEISLNSIYVKSVNEFMNQFELMLMLDSPEYALEKKYKKKIDSLEMTIRQKDQEINDLKNQILWYNNTNKDLKNIYNKLKEKFEK